jgi:hypothetical protein
MLWCALVQIFHRQSVLLVATWRIWASFIADSEILLYLWGTTDVGLVNDRGCGIGSSVIGYVDSDYAGDLDKRRSLTGFVSRDVPLVGKRH